MNTILFILNFLQILFYFSFFFFSSLIYLIIFHFPSSFSFFLSLLFYFRVPWNFSTEIPSINIPLSGSLSVSLPFTFFRYVQFYFQPFLLLFHANFILIFIFIYISFILYIVSVCH